MKISTKTITSVGISVSISIILTRLLSFMPVPSIRISFGDIPIMLVGMISGPLAGAVTGALSDLLGMFIFTTPTGAAYFPGFTLSKILVGLIPALIYRYFRVKDMLKVAVAVIITEIVCSFTLDTIWLSIILNKGALILLPPRVIARIIIMIIEIPVIYIISKRIGRIAA